MKLVQIGAGTWGKNYLKTLKDFPVEVIVANRTNWKSLLDTKPQGVIVATHPGVRTEIAEYALQLGIPCLLEKPVSLQVSEVERLKKYDIPILVNHIHLFSSEYQKLKQYRLPEQIVIELGNSSPERSYSDLWDYGSHVFAIILDLWDTYFEEIRIKDHVNTPNHWFTSLKFMGNSAIAYYGNRFIEKKSYVDTYHLGQFSTYDSTLNSGSPSPLHNAIEIFLNGIEGKEDPRLGLDLALEVTKTLEWLQWTSP